MNINLYILIPSILIGYLLGSISFASIITKKIKGLDIKEMGSGNAGTTNVLRSVGFLPALVTFLLDLFKGTLGAIIPWAIVYFTIVKGPGIYMVLGGIATIIGHTFPVFFKFKGGKGVATYLGVILAINPLVFAINVFIMLTIILITRMVSLASITISIVTPILMVFLNKNSISPDEKWIFALAFLLIGAVITFMHRENIKRIREGAENKITFKK